MKRLSSIDLAIRCYPQWWIERYDEEVRATVVDLTAEGRSGQLIALDLFRDALRARVLGRGIPQNYGHLAARTRMSITAATIPWLVVAPIVTIITGQVFLHSNAGGVHAHLPYIYSFFGNGVMSTAAHGYQHPPMSFATQVLGVSSRLFGLLTLITFIVLAAGWSACRDGVKNSETLGGRHFVRTSRAPLAFVLVILLMKMLQSYLSPHTFHQTGNGPIVALGGHPLVAALLGDATWAFAISGWIFTMVLAISIAQKVDLPPYALRYGRTVSVVTAALTFLSFAAFATWCAALVAQSHQSPLVGTVTASYPHDAIWLPMALAFAVAVVVSSLGATNATRSWRVISTQRLWDS